MTELLLKRESYQIIGLCMEVHRVLGRVLDEVVYKDALAHEFQENGISFAREQKFEIRYKSIVLPHSYFADFVVFGQIILEVKAVQGLGPSHIKQTLNYLAASRLPLGLLVNFGESSLKHQRVVL